MEHTLFDQTINPIDVQPINCPEALNGSVQIQETPSWDQFEVGEGDTCKDARSLSELLAALHNGDYGKLKCPPGTISERLRQDNVIPENSGVSLPRFEDPCKITLFGGSESPQIPNSPGQRRFYGEFVIESRDCGDSWENLPSVPFDPKYKFNSVYAVDPEGFMTTEENPVVIISGQEPDQLYATEARFLNENGDWEQTPLFAKRPDGNWKQVAYWGSTVWDMYHEQKDYFEINNFETTETWSEYYQRILESGDLGENQILNTGEWISVVKTKPIN